MKEKRFVKRVVKHLLKSHATISAERPDLAGLALYREVLLHTQLVDPELVDETLWQAEDSVDDWTTDSEQELGFRQVAHFVAMSQYWAAGNVGTVVSFRDIVYSLIPANL
jgi:hypothetical protein